MKHDWHGLFWSLAPVAVVVVWMVYILLFAHGQAMVM